MGSKKTLATIYMRSGVDFKNRFDMARRRKGWTVQVALERILSAWIENEERIK